VTLARRAAPDIAQGLKMKNKFLKGSAILAVTLLASGCGGSSGDGESPQTAHPITVVPGSKPQPKPTPTPSPTPAPAPTPTPTPTPTATQPSTAGASRLSIFVGNNPTDLSQFANWLGRQPDVLELHGGEADWSDWKNSLSWQAGLFRNKVSDIEWSVPLIPKGATLDEAAKGSYDANYRALAQQFVNLWPNDKQIYIRLGWEFNGKGWRTWSAVGKASQFIGAYRHFVAAFRSVAPDRFKFEWTPNVGDVGMDPATAYPGDDVVDVIGMDFYYDTKYLGTDPVKAWNTMVNQKWGLQWHQDFAAAHHKPTAYAEWGVNSDTAGPYIELADKWFTSHNVLYQNYWNSNSNFRGDLSDGQYPKASATYKSIYGKKPTAGAIAVP